MQKKWLLVLSFAVGGCYQDPGPPEPWVPSVEQTSKSLEIVFKGSSTVLSSSQILRLRQMSVTGERKIFRHIRLVGHRGQKKDGGISDRLRARFQTLVKELVGQGFSPKNINLLYLKDQEAGETKGSQTVTVFFDHYQAHAPRCPGWEEDMHLLLTPEGEANFGCASAGNLAAMVADPRDLLQGKPLADGDGPRNSLAVVNLRTDKTKELKVETVNEAK